MRNNIRGAYLEASLLETDLEGAVVEQTLLVEIQQTLAETRKVRRGRL